MVHNPKIMFYVRELLPSNRFVSPREYTLFLEQTVRYLSFGFQRVRCYLRYLYEHGDAIRRKQDGIYVYRRNGHA